MKIAKKSKILLLTFILIFISNSLVFAEDSKLKSPDQVKWEEETIYFILTDRFFDGDKSNNEVYGKESYDINHLEAYHGGDFQGIIDKVDYLKDLGITTLWITPIVKNIETNMRASENDKQFGYHGYWAEDFTKIDPHLGDEAKLKELIDVLADNGIKLMVDVVLNHSGYGTENLPQFKGLIREKNGAGDILGSLSGLPDFKTEEKEVRDKIIKWQTDWIRNLKTEKGNSISYFRVDTVKHVDYDTWKDFKSEIKEIDPNFKLMGEVFDASVTNTRKYLDPSMMDSLLDFDFKNIARKMTKGKFEEVEKNLENRNEKLTNDTTMSQFLSSHDEHGFLKMKLNGNKNLFKTAATLQLTTKGVPVIYYGEEIGMSGQKDNFDKGIYNENRVSFKWDDIENNDMLNHYKKLLKIKKSMKDIFANGNRELVYSDENVYVFSREFDNRKFLTAINISEDPQEIKIDNKFDDNALYDLYNEKKIKSNGDNFGLTVPASKDGGTSIIVEEKMVPKDFGIAQNESSPIVYALIGSAIVVSIIAFVLLRKNKVE